MGNSGQLDLFLVVECGDWFPTLFLNGHLSSKSFCRLPSPFNKGSKCPTITNPSCKDSGSHSNSNLNNSRSSRSTPTSSDRNKAQLNQQNNNVTSGKFKSCSSDNQGMLQRKVWKFGKMNMHKFLFDFKLLGCCSIIYAMHI